jgi:hypothetical protein
MNLPDIRTYVRNLTGIQTTDLVSDALIDAWINEAYFELGRMQVWPWLPITTLAGTASPAFDAQYHPVLAYRAAIKVLRFLSDDTQRAEAYTQEAQLIIIDMQKDYLPALAPGASSTLAQLRRFTKDLSGMYDGSISDAMINAFINDAYFELASARDWDWLEANIEVPVPAFTSGKHTINLTSGTRRILDAVLVSPEGTVKRMIQVPTLSDVSDWDNEVKYDVTVSGVMTFAPEQPTDYTVRVRYMTAAPTLGESDSPAFLYQFHKILAYRAAVKILVASKPDDPRIGIYSGEYQSMYDSLLAMYELDHDTFIIQMGSEGNNYRSYVPWFRPA